MEEFAENERYSVLLYLFIFIIVYHFLALITMVFIPHELGDQEEAPKFDINDEVVETETKDVKEKETEKFVSYIEWKNLNYEVRNKKNPDERLILLNKVSIKVLQSINALHCLFSGSRLCKAG